MRPKILELFCCGGGSAMGYSRAGYDPYGVDNDPKRLRDFPFPWLVADAIETLQRLIAGEGITFSNGETLYLKDFAAIHASPPCQGYSIMNNLPWIRSRTYPLLILPVRELLNEIGLPYVIENVAGAASKKNLEKLGLLEHRLRAGWLCGGMFGLPIYRHRYFETNWFWIQPGHPKHQRATSPPMAGNSPGNAFKGSWDKYKHTNAMGSASGKASYQGNGAQKEGVADGHAVGWRVAAEAMGIDWMRRSELTQAIPPVMTEYLGTQLMAVLL